MVYLTDCLNFKVGDELLLAPLGLFNTEVFALTGQDKRGQGQANASGDPEDPHDANYLRETSVSFHFKLLKFLSLLLEKWLF